MASTNPRLELTDASQKLHSRVSVSITRSSANKGLPPLIYSAADRQEEEEEEGEEQEEEEEEREEEEEEEASVYLVSDNRKKHVCSAR